MENLVRQADEQKIQTLEAIRLAPRRLVELSPALEAQRAALKVYLYKNLYLSSEMETVHAHATHIVSSLFEHLYKNPALLPVDHQEQIPAEGLARTVADYIAGMTDSFIDRTWRSVQKY